MCPKRQFAKTVYSKRAINLKLLHECHWKIADLWWILLGSFVKQHSNCRETFWGKTVMQIKVFFDFFSDIEWQPSKVPTILFPHGCSNCFLPIRIGRKFCSKFCPKLWGENIVFEIIWTFHILSDSKQNIISFSLTSFWQGCQSCSQSVHKKYIGRKDCIFSNKIFSGIWT